MKLHGQRKQTCTCLCDQDSLIQPSTKGFPCTCPVQGLGNGARRRQPANGVPIPHSGPRQGGSSQGQRLPETLQQNHASSQQGTEEIILGGSRGVQEEQIKVLQRVGSRRGTPWSRTCRAGARLSMNDSISPVSPWEQEAGKPRHA